MTKTRWILLILLAAATSRVALWRAGRARALVLCGDIETKPGRLLGSVAHLPNGFWGLEGPRWESPPGTVPFSGEVWLAPRVVGHSPAFGREVAVSGPLHCLSSKRNPGRLADGTASWEPPRLLVNGSHNRIRILSGRATWAVRFQQSFEDGLDRLFAGAPGWLAVERVVWLGDATLLPAALLAFFRQDGLMHVLALSGQRVNALVLICLVLMRVAIAVLLPLRAWRYCGRWYRYLHRLLPLLCCTLLYLTSHSMGPLKRTLAMCAALFGLRLRRLDSSTSQIVFSSVACLLVAEPSLVGNPGFLLSAAATALLCQMTAEGAWRRGARAYFLIGSVMPVLVFPLSAFFFAKISLLAPIHSLLLGWIWMLVLVPLGFVAPLICLLIPEPLRASFCFLLDRGWQRLVDFHLYWDAHVASGYFSVIRPTWIELAAGEVTLLVLALHLVRRFFPVEEIPH